MPPAEAAWASLLAAPEGAWASLLAGLSHEVLEKLTANPSRVHCGPRRGNILHVDTQDLDKETDGIVSGPPCPPFSSIGPRLVEQDVWSLLAERVGPRRPWPPKLYYK